MDWKTELNGLLGVKRETRGEKEDAMFHDFLEKTVLPAFETLGDELSKYGRTAIVRETPIAATLIVKSGEDEEISFCVLRRLMTSAIVPYAEVRARERLGLRMTKVEAAFRDGAEIYGLADVTQDDVIRVFMKHYSSSLSSPGIG